MAVAKTTNGGSIVRWIGVAVTMVVMLVGATLWLGHVQASTVSNERDSVRNRKRIESLEEGNKEIREVLHRMDKRQVLMMHKLSAGEGHNDPP